MARLHNSNKSFLDDPSDIARRKTLCIHNSTVVFWWILGYLSYSYNYKNVKVYDVSRAFILQSFTYLKCIQIIKDLKICCDSWILRAGQGEIEAVGEEHNKNVFGSLSPDVNEPYLEVLPYALKDACHYV